MSTIAVIGLGCFGLPLVIEFGRHARTIGFDILAAKVSKCRAGTDPSREIPDAEMALAVHAEYTADPALLCEADFIIVAAPTPVDEVHIEYGVTPLPWEALPRADAIVAAVAHRGFLALGTEDLTRKLVKGGCFVDVKAAFDAVALLAAGVRVWRL